MSKRDRILAQGEKTWPVVSRVGCCLAAGSRSLAAWVLRTQRGRKPACRRSSSASTGRRNTSTSSASMPTPRTTTSWPSSTWTASSPSYGTDHSTSSTSARRATRRTTSASPTTARTSGAAACSPTASSSSTWPPTRPSRSWSRCSTTCPTRPGLPAPHSPYALPGRMLLSFLGGKDGGLPAGLAEFTNDGKFIRKLDAAEGRALRLRRGHQAGLEPHGHVELHAAATTTRSRWPRWTSSTSATSCSSGTSASARCCRR